MNHTFLFQEGVWVARGYYIDEVNCQTPLEGESQIIHLDNIWLNKGKMKLLGENQSEFENRYDIVPFTQGKNFTDWTSSNPAIGKLIGKFAVVEDSILSTYQSEDGCYIGVEYVRKVNEKVYQNRGTLFKGDQKQSSWAAELTRVK